MLSGGKFLEVSVKVYHEVSHAKLVHDRDKLCLELGLHIMGDMFDGGHDGVLDCEGRVYNNAEVLNLKVSLVQGFERASIIKVMVEGYSKVGVCDGGNESGVFGRGREQAEVITIDWDVDRQDRRDFYHRQR